MRVAADDNLKSSRNRVKIECMHVMQNVDRDIACLSHGRLGEFAPRPRFGIDISAHGDDGRYLSELGQDAGISDVAGVHDQLGATQRGQRFFPKQSVRI